MVDDAELLRRYAGEKSEAAFAELVQRHLDLVYSAALRRLGGDVHAAADVAQQVFIALARQAASLARGVVLPGWLYTTTRNVAVDFIRAEQRRRAREQAAHTMNELTSTPPSDAAWDQLRPVLDEVMDELSAADREIIVLRFFARRSFADVGTAFSVSEDAARMRVDRALDKLRAVLAQRQITSTAAALAAVLANQPAVAVPPGLAATVTGAAVAGGSVVGVLGFMSSIKSGLSVVGLLALLMTLGVAIYERHARDEAVQALVVAQQEHALHVGDLRAKEHQTQVAEEETTRLQKELDAARAASKLAQEAATAAQASATWDPLAEGRTFLGRHPEGKRALDDYASASKRFQYAPMYRALGLTPEQIRLWEALGGGTMGASLAGGRSISMPFGTYGAPLTGPEYTQKLRAALGDEGMKQLQKFQKIASARSMAADVAGSLYFTETPLRPEQADQLVQVLVDSRNTGPAAQSSAYDWNAVIAKASAVLTPPQVAVLAGKRASDLFQKALSRPRGESAAPSAATANPGK